MFSKTCLNKSECTKERVLTGKNEIVCRDIPMRSDLEWSSCVRPNFVTNLKSNSNLNCIRIPHIKLFELKLESALVTSCRLSIRNIITSSFSMQ